jgi:triacylglycerol lipase
VPGVCPAACEELVPGSSMLDRLQGTASATRPPWLSLWTTDDQVVQPPDSARLPGAVNIALQSICPGVSIGHGQLPTAPLVVGLVLRTLHGTPLTAPVPSDCRSLQALGGSGP